jgi:hypothetical protein
MTSSIGPMSPTSVGPMNYVEIGDKVLVPNPSGEGLVHANFLGVDGRARGHHRARPV